MKKKVVRESCGRRMAVWSLAAMMLLGSMGMQAQGTVGVPACCKAKVATAAVAQPVADDVRAQWQQLKGDVTLYMTNDMGRNGYYDQKPIAELMGEMAGVVDPECVFAAGDIHHFNGVASLQDPLWMTNYELVYSHPDLMLDWFPVCGNHEYRGNTQAFMDYGKVSRRWMMPARYYTKVFSHHNTTIRVVMLDTTPLIDSYRKNSAVYLDACKQDAGMDINCEVDDPDKGAPLAFDRSWSFDLQQGSPALSGGVTDFARIFPNGIPFFGMKKVNFLDSANDQNYYFSAPLPQPRFGAWL